jgi:ChrR Cupin-like domain
LSLSGICRLRESLPGNAHPNLLNPYFHSQILLCVAPSAFTSYSPTALPSALTMELYVLTEKVTHLHFSVTRNKASPTWSTFSVFRPVILPIQELLGHLWEGSNLQAEVLALLGQPNCDRNAQITAWNSGFVMTEATCSTKKPLGARNQELSRHYRNLVPREFLWRYDCCPLGGDMKSMLGLFLLIASMFAQHAPNQTMFTPDQVQYGPVPAFLPVGAQLAVLEGDPTASTGDFTIRLKMPNGYRIPPHWHPNRENATVISGNFKVGMGDTFDESKMTTFGAGSFGYMDPSMHHYVMAFGEVVVQVHGMSPLQVNYINPNDDPSKKK